MDNKLDKLLLSLDDEIIRKCAQIKKQKVEKLMGIFFIITIVFVITVPLILVYIGVNVFAIFLPIVLFLGIAFLSLTPFLFNDKLGGLTK